MSKQEGEERVGGGRVTSLEWRLNGGVGRGG